VVADFSMGRFGNRFLGVAEGSGCHLSCRSAMHNNSNTATLNAFQSGELQTFKSSFPGFFLSSFMSNWNNAEDSYRNSSKSIVALFHFIAAPRRRPPNGACSPGGAQRNPGGTALLGRISFILLCGGIAFGMEIPRSGFDAGDYALKSIEMGHPKRINVGGSSVHEVGEVKILFFGCIERADTGWRDYTEVTRLPGNSLENLGSLCDLSAGCPDFSGSSWGQTLVCDREDCTVSFVKNVQNLNYRLLRGRVGKSLRGSGNNLRRGCANRLLVGSASLGNTSAISGVEPSERSDNGSWAKERRNQSRDGSNSYPNECPRRVYLFAAICYLVTLALNGIVFCGRIYAALWTAENYPGTGRHRIHLRWVFISAGLIVDSAFHLGIAYRVFRDGVFNAWY